MELEDVYQLYLNDLYRYLYSLTKDHYIAEDLVQETFYRAFVSLDDYEFHHIKAWLFKVAYNAFIDYERKNKRIIFKNEIHHREEADQNTPESNVLQKESLARLLSYLDTLAENEKHALVLCDLHDLPYKEAAAILNLKLNTFKSHLSRGRKKLIQIINERKLDHDEQRRGRS